MVGCGVAVGIEVRGVYCRSENVMRKTNRVEGGYFFFPLPKKKQTGGSREERERHNAGTLGAYFVLESMYRPSDAQCRYCVEKYNERKKKGG